METFEQLQLKNIPNCVVQPSSARAFPASPIALQEKVRAMVTSATCGAKWHELSLNFGHVGLSVKTFQDYSQEAMDGISVVSCPALPKWGIRSHGGFGELVMSAHRRKHEKDCLLWPTPTVCGNYNRKGASKTSGDGLATAVRLWSTPLASDTGHRKKKFAQGGTALSCQVSGKLNPTWVEWLMGFPLGWTDLDA